VKSLCCFDAPVSSANHATDPAFPIVASKFVGTPVTSVFCDGNNAAVRKLQRLVAQLRQPRATGNHGPCPHPQYDYNDYCNYLEGGQSWKTILGLLQKRKPSLVKS
jgi:hypothetical protein